jgi:4-carboxymuconolactone decarboxylase
MNEKLPKPTRALQKEFPKVWKSFQELGKECHSASPLDERVRRLVKIGNARKAGVPPAEIRHAILLSITTVGFPRRHGRARLGRRHPEARSKVDILL